MSVQIIPHLEYCYICGKKEQEDRDPAIKCMADEACTDGNQYVHFLRVCDSCKEKTRIALEQHRLEMSAAYKRI